ncbi:glycoside hydrolase family 2 TIM barrel-domain containing protein [Nonlabens sp. Hel1_33_55]|uniref:glycoside hydrolase family 2 TIM barrel-domain containing protein n=1 Tax=Nonlabens sp. Hel1_33_55 TaxID=1336802 RepID=UPI000B848B80|nr:glycoside hydrolase family 2 TIM barrel-domain containing protein [Nonlabens sp. Hel1_33_55]
MKNILFSILLMFSFFAGYSQVQKVSIMDDLNGQTLIVDGKPFIINGMNWDYVPIGRNYSYNFWAESDDFIRAALDSEMGLLKNMGVNTIRVYVGMQPKWVQYIYENYGIYTMINHSFGRYGLTIDGVWVPNTEYDDPATRELLMRETKSMVEDFKNVPGLLLFMLGNENNYGLSWGGAETEDIPIETEGTVITRARAMYKTFNDAVLEMKKLDSQHPVAICNGDLLYLDLVAEYCTDIDIYATNMYRGVSFADAFDRVKNELGKPLMFSEFGSDAFNALDNKEDQKMQAYYMFNNWKEIYENAAGLGKAENSIGGFTFQFSDGWWKRGQTEDLDIHNTEASWLSGGYAMDTDGTSKNMNEEWFGIAAKGYSNERGLYELYPRAAYYALKEVHQLDPYADGMNLEKMQNYFDSISIMDAVLRARGDAAALGGGGSGPKLAISNLSARFTTFTTGGSLITTPETADPDSNAFPDELGFDHMQSYFIGVEGKPSANMRAEVNFNVIGRVAQNPINEIFYENRARPVVTLDNTNQRVVIDDVNRVNVYNAEFEWNAKDFDLRGFYRTGHYHWGYEGDFFGLYPEANYGPNLDIYGGEFLGVEIDGKGVLDGAKAAFGPQLWWGGNPTSLFKYRRNVSGIDVTGIYHRDVETEIILGDDGRRELNPNQLRSGIIPPFPTERATLVLEKEVGKFGFMLGGIWAGSPLNGLTYQDVKGEPGNYTVFQDKVKSSDNWGAKAKVTYQGGKINWYAQGGVNGLVAQGGADQTQTFTGWRLKDIGSGNMSNFLTGFTYTMGDWQIAPNFLYQKPLVEAMPSDTGAPGRLRNVIDDPFAVRGNRETTAGELLLTFDPTPGTWFYEWENDRTEDAPLAFSAGFVFWHLPTKQDAHIGFNANRTFFPFPDSVPAEDLWEANSRIVSKISPELALIGNLYYGKSQPNGDSERLIYRYGGDLRLVYNKMKLISEVKVNDWGPYDYHRDFNLTFPLQLMLDLSYSLSKPDWFILPSTVMGIRGTWRSLDQFSPRYSPNNSAEFANQPTISPVGFPNGSEWEIRTYVHINIGK